MMLSSIYLLGASCLGFGLQQLVVSTSIPHSFSSVVTPAPLRFSKRARLISQSYDQFQISDGVSGNCGSKAEAVFLRPYGLTQATLAAGNPIPVAIDNTDLLICKKMTRLAVNAEASFNQAISRVGGAKTAIGNQLQNGKTCNKVLKLTGAVLSLQF
ncbi:hypothetical protein VP01_1640g1 [Puccinia sorghi]|uniref:Uncharacterized protein n=1 Tax=Puccinia sorghi TaxID=27349 RepID=A0A0L6VGS6_9BASI|nr:hypothetical protein VP01_1640g1 [Puccinia sorghi]